MIPLVKSTFYKEEYTKKELKKFINRAKKLSFGEECEKFEARFASWQGRKHAVFLNSGSSANVAVIQALLNLGRLKKGDKVGFSSLTWSTNVMPLIELGLTPVPIDVELNTLNISSRNVGDVLQKVNLKAIFITNLLGFCDDIDKIKKICDTNEILLIEDNCEALGSVYKKKKLGNFGLVSTFSFYVGHHMSTIEGGAVCTDDEKLADMLKIVRAHGWDRNLTSENQTKLRTMHEVNSSFYSRYTFYDLGYNFRPTELAGFIGNVQMKFIDEVIINRQCNFLDLVNYFNNIDKFYPLKYKHMEVVSNFAFPLICKTQQIRDEVVERCNNKIEIRPVVGGNISSQPFFIKYISKTNIDCPNASLVHERGLYFGNNPEMTSREISIIKKTIY